MATHSSVLAWRILWTEEPGGLLSMGSHRVRHDWSGLACMHAFGEGSGNLLHILAWRIPGTEEPGGLPSMGSHRVRHDWSDLACMHAWLSPKRHRGPAWFAGEMLYFQMKVSLYVNGRVQVTSSRSGVSRLGGIPCLLPDPCPLKQAGYTKYQGPFVKPLWSNGRTGLFRDPHEMVRHWGFLLCQSVLTLISCTLRTQVLRRNTLILLWV